MTLNEYYSLILNRYISGSYKLKVAKTSMETPIIKDKEFPLHALNYMIFEYLKDNRDNRWKLLLDFVLVPIGLNSNVDFSKVGFEEFFQFMLSLKN